MNIPETDDEKNNDTLNIDDNFLFIINEDNYEELFKKIKFIKSKKLVNCLMMKILRFNEDYNNPKRLKILSQLRTMKAPYKKVFGEDFI